MIRQPSVIHDSVVAGTNLSTGHFVLIREDTYIGNNVSVGTHSEIGHHVIIGDNVRIHSGCFVPEYTVIGDGAWLGPRVVITNTPHPTCPKAKECLQKMAVTIEAGAIICAGALLMPGVTIGKGAIVGAGALVTESVRPNTIVVGVPAFELKGELNHPKEPAEIVCWMEEYNGFRPYSPR